MRLIMMEFKFAKAFDQIEYKLSEMISVENPLLTLLCDAKIINDYEREKVQKESVSFDKGLKLIEFLKRKDDKMFNKFCEILSDVRGDAVQLIHKNLEAQALSGGENKAAPELSVVECRNNTEPEANVIATIGSRTGAVTGLTLYGNELFVIRLCKPEGVIEVYDATTNAYAFKRLMKVSDFDGCHVRGLTSCDKYECLYVSGWLSPSNDGYIFRVEMTGGNTVSKWTVVGGVGHPRGLSVNSQHNLLVACVQPDLLLEYTTRGDLVRQISLQSDIVYPRHAIQLNRDQFLVCHGNLPDTQHRVSEVDANGHVLNKFGGAPGSEIEQLNVPQSLTVINKNSIIFVADMENNRVVLLGSSLKRSRDLRIEGGDVKGPYSLCFDEQRRLLLVGEWNDVNSRIILLNVEGLSPS